MGSSQVRDASGRHRKVEFKAIEQIERVGEPVEVRPAGDSER